MTDSNNRQSCYYTKLAACYCRGVLGLPLDTPEQTAIDAGVAAKLPHLYRFKRNDVVLLPRVREILGVVQSFAVTNILDVASQRGALLWPLLDTLHRQGGAARVKSIDSHEEIVGFLSAVVRGGGASEFGFTAEQADVTDLCNQARRDGLAEFGEGEFDCVIASEILEHLSNPPAAAREMLRVTSHLIICTVPAQPDHNTEHIQLFYDKRPHEEKKITRPVQRNQTDLRKLWQDAGASSVKIRVVNDGPISVLLAIIMK